MYYIQNVLHVSLWQLILLGHCKVSFMRDCPFLGGSFIGGFTLFFSKTTYDLLSELDGTDVKFRSGGKSQRTWFTQKL